MQISLQATLTSCLLALSLGAMETNDETELHNAALHGKVEMVKELLNQNG